MISIYDNDNDNHTSINTLVKTLGEKFACIINDVAKSDEVKNFIQSFITFLEDIASGKIQPDKDFIQGMIEIYRNNPADVPESIRGYVKAFAEFLEKSKAVALSYNGDAIEALALVRGRGKINPYTEVLDVKGVNIFAPESALKIGAGAVKIYRYAVSEFTKRNHCNANDERLKLRYILDVKDFAEANGVDTQDPDAMKNFRRKLKASLDKLQTASITWTEKIKGKPKAFIGMNYIGGYEIRGNELEIEFTLKMAQYLTSLPLIIYPRSMYALDDRDFNAYAIGEAMCIHYSQENNVIRGTEGKLRVETLLMSTSYPSYEEIKAHEISWVQKVKEPFETALDKLTQCGLIKDWVYCHEGGIELTDKEAAKIAEMGYAYFTALIVKYELNDFESHDDRAVAIQEKKALQIEKAKRTRKRKKTQDTQDTE